MQTVVMQNESAQTVVGERQRDGADEPADGDDQRVAHGGGAEDARGRRPGRRAALHAADAARGRVVRELEVEADDRDAAREDGRGDVQDGAARTDRGRCGDDARSGGPPARAPNVCAGKHSPAGRGGGEQKASRAPSQENDCIWVAAREAVTVTTEERSSWSPVVVCRHTRLEPEDHAAVEHAPSAPCAVGVLSQVLKFRPETVMLPPQHMSRRRGAEREDPPKKPRLRQKRPPQKSAAANITKVPKTQLACGDKDPERPLNKFRLRRKVRK